jgi:hypothetical protein
MSTYRPLIAKLSVLVPQEVQTTALAASADGTLAIVQDAKVVSRKGVTYNSTDIDASRVVQRFNARFDAMNSIFWTGTLTLYDSAASGLSLLSNFGQLDNNVIVRFQFGADYDVGPDSFAHAPIYEAILLRANYNLNNDGVQIICELAGETEDRATASEFIAKVKKARTILGSEEYDRINKAAIKTNYVSTGVAGAPTGTPARYCWDEFREIAADAGWTNLVVESYANAPGYCRNTRNINPQPNETFISLAKRLAENAVTPNGESFRFYVKRNSAGALEYHFHSPSFAQRPGFGLHRFVYGGEDGRVVSASIESKLMTCALLGAAQARAYGKIATGLNTGAQGAYNFFMDKGSVQSIDPTTALSIGKNVVDVVVKGGGSYDEVVQRVANYMTDLREQLLELTLTVVGTHELQPYDLIDFYYMLKEAKHFSSGLYRIKSIQHEVSASSGWVTVLEAYRESPRVLNVGRNAGTKDLFGGKTSLEFTNDILRDILNSPRGEDVPERVKAPFEDSLKALRGDPAQQKPGESSARIVGDTVLGLYDKSYNLRIYEAQWFPASGQSVIKPPSDPTVRTMQFTIPEAQK